MLLTINIVFMLALTSIRDWYPWLFCATGAAVPLALTSIRDWYTLPKRSIRESFSSCINLYKGLIQVGNFNVVLLTLALTSIRDWYLTSITINPFNEKSCINLYKGLIRQTDGDKNASEMLALTSIRDWYLFPVLQHTLYCFSCINLYKGIEKTDTVWRPFFCA